MNSGKGGVLAKWKHVCLPHGQPPLSPSQLLPCENLDPVLPDLQEKSEIEPWQIIKDDYFKTLC